MTETGATPSLFDLTDELLVASTLLAMMGAPHADIPVLRGMCSTAVERCQALVEELVRIDRRLMSEGER
jgi:hypothetical protein